MTAPNPIVSGQIKQSNLQFSIGNASNIVLVRTFYQWTMVAPGIDGMTSQLSNGQALLTSAAAFCNEPLFLGSSHLRLIRRLFRARDGVAAVEFAFIAPVLILAYCGIAELCGAMLAERKAYHAASAIGDLVAQSAAPTPSNITDIFTVATQDDIMAPYSATGMNMRVSSVVMNAADTQATVGWSCGYGAYASLPKGRRGHIAQQQYDPGEPESGHGGGAVQLYLADPVRHADRADLHREVLPAAAAGRPNSGPGGLAL